MERHEKIIHSKLKGKKQTIMQKDFFCKVFLYLNLSHSLPLGVGVVVDVITYHVNHKYFTFCTIFPIIGTYLRKLQGDTYPITKYRMVFSACRLWSVNCDLPEILTIWVCLQVTYEGFILLWKCEHLNFVHLAKV